jgi:PadR family transcriptional regulator PadR
MMPSPRFPIPQGSLYPALHRLQKRGWLRAAARFYSLTPAGRRRLAVEKDGWARLSGAVNLTFDEGSR